MQQVKTEVKQEPIAPSTVIDLSNDDSQRDFSTAVADAPTERRYPL
jgi:hypothetical protein